MKKLAALVFSTLLVVALGSPAFAQGISVGAKAGVNVAKFGGDIEGVDSRTSFAAGGALGLDLLPIFGIEVNALFSQKGTKDQETVDTGAGLTTVEATFKLNYLEVPVLATVNVPVVGSPIKPRVYAGPAVAVELSCNIEASAAGLSDSIDCDDSVLEGGFERKKVDFGLLFGAGVDFPAGPGALTLDGRYNVGLSNINDVPGSTVDVKNRTWQILGGYMIHLGL
jgi:hypothetical protein